MPHFEGHRLLEIPRDTCALTLKPADNFRAPVDPQAHRPPVVALMTSQAGEELSFWGRQACFPDSAPHLAFLGSKRLSSLAFPQERAPFSSRSHAAASSLLYAVF